MHAYRDGLRWDDLRVLLAVLREGSFSAAAIALGIEQSTVSRRIAALEETLAQPLFERHRQGPRPTEIADSLRARLERIEGDVRALVDTVEARDPEVRGRVRLALTESLAVHAVIPRFLSPLRAMHPHLDIDLVTGDAAVDLARREADLALRFFRPTGDDLVVKRVALMQTAVLASRKYGGLARTKVTELDWISYELPGIETPENAYLRRHVAVEPILRTNGFMAQVEAVRAGLGVGLLARSLSLIDPELVELDLGLPNGPTLELWLVCPKSLREVPRVDAVWTALENALSVLGGVRPRRRRAG